MPCFRRCMPFRRLHDVFAQMAHCQELDSPLPKGRSTVTTKINEMLHGSSFSAQSPTEVRFVTADFGPLDRDKLDFWR